MYMRKLWGFCPRLLGSLPSRVQTSVHSVAFSDEGDNKAAAQKQQLEEFMRSLDETALQRVQEIEHVMERLRMENKRVPDAILPQDWEVLLAEHHTFSARLKYLNYIFIKEKRQMHAKAKKEARKLQRLENLEANYSDPHRFSCHIPLRDKYIKWWSGIQAMTSNTRVVVDLDFEQTQQEQTNATSQILMMWGDNLKHLQPLNLHFTSIHKNLKFVASIKPESRVFVTAHEEHYLDIFPHQDLVYLSPDGPPLKNFDVSCVYVIGGLVDKAGKPKLTFANSRKHGIRCASLPIKLYCDAGTSTKKELTLNCVYKIILDMYLHHSWADAFRDHLPKGYASRNDSAAGTYINGRAAMMEKQEQSRFQRNIRDILVQSNWQNNRS